MFRLSVSGDLVKGNQQASERQQVSVRLQNIVLFKWSQRRKINEQFLNRP
jgi:hypothetical protein